MVLILISRKCWVIQSDWRRNGWGGAVLFNTAPSDTMGSGRGVITAKRVGPFCEITLIAWDKAWEAIKSRSSTNLYSGRRDRSCAFWHYWHGTGERWLAACDMWYLINLFGGGDFFDFFILVVISAHVKRFSVSDMRDFLLQIQTSESLHHDCLNFVSQWKSSVEVGNE